MLRIVNAAPAGAYPSSVSKNKAPQASGALLSDKGRYLLSALSVFCNHAGAIEAPMNGGWRDALRQLGGAPAEKNGTTLQLCCLLTKQLAVRDQTSRASLIDIGNLNAVSADPFRHDSSRP